MRPRLHHSANLRPLAPQRQRRPLPRLAAWGLTLALLGGCATAPPQAVPSPKDPLEGWNRQVFALNEAVDVALLKPLAQTYRTLLPDPVRAGVDNFFGNLGDAWSSLHLILQAKPKAGLDMGMRTATNTVLGLGGVLDVAGPLGLQRISTEDSGQTLGRWGVPAGPYLVLPLFGPSTLRDALVLPIDSAGTGSSLLVEDAGLSNATVLLKVVATRSRLLDAGRVLDDIALDKYSLVRDAFLARRRSLVYDGDPPDDD